MMDLPFTGGHLGVGVSPRGGSPGWGEGGGEPFTPVRVSTPPSKVSSAGILGAGACGSRGGGEQARRAARPAPRPGCAARHAGRSGGGGRRWGRDALVRGAGRSPSSAGRGQGQAPRHASLRGEGVPNRDSLREILGRLVGGAAEPSGGGPLQRGEGKSVRPRGAVMSTLVEKAVESPMSLNIRATFWTSARAGTPRRSVSPTPSARGFAQRMTPATFMRAQAAHSAARTGDGTATCGRILSLRVQSPRLQSRQG
jgi:hypothetical protein